MGTGGVTVHRPLPLCQMDTHPSDAGCNRSLESESWGWIVQWVPYQHSVGDGCRIGS